MHAFVSRSQGSGTGKKKFLKMERLDMQLKGLNADVILCSLYSNERSGKCCGLCAGIVCSVGDRSQCGQDACGNR